MIICGDSLTELVRLDSDSVDCCITSPPYWGLRDYGVECQLGLEKTPEEYVAKMVAVFREVKRVLRGDGTLWLNLGDSYNGSGGDHKRTLPTDSFQGGIMRGVQSKKDFTLKPKDLVGIPWRVAFALQADCWYLRQDIIWHKPNPMPESVRDRCTKAHEYVFLMSKNAKYCYDADAISEPCDVQERNGLGVPKGEWDEVRGIRRHRACKTAGNKTGYRNRRSVWTVTTKPFKEAHFATFPPDLIAPMVLAGCPKGGTVLDPFFGSGTTGVVAKKLGRQFIGIELNKQYCEMAERRIKKTQGSLFNGTDNKRIT